MHAMSNSGLSCARQSANIIMIGNSQHLNPSRCRPLH